MELYTSFIFILFVVHYEETEAYERGELRMDDNIYYLKHQDIVKAINHSETPWLYGYSYDPQYSREEENKDFLKVEGKCIYFRKIDLNNTNVHFNKHVLEIPKEAEGQKTAEERDDPQDGKESEDSKKPKDDKDKVTDLYGTFFNTTIKNLQSEDDNRNTSNGITVTTVPGEKSGRSFKLVYSDYIDCSILRPVTLSQEQAAGSSHQSYNNEKSRCILLLSDAAARNQYPPGRKPKELPYWMKQLPRDMPEGLPQGMPKFCQVIYRYLCGYKAKLITVFDKNCPKISNPLGC